jgi:hypothetical protein
MTRSLLTLLVLLSFSVQGVAQDGDPKPVAEGVAVVIQVNDSMVKDKVLPGVEILWKTSGDAAERSLGKTGADGRLSCNLPKGSVLLSYQLQDYVPITNSKTVIREPGQIITTTLTMMLESTDQTGKRRVQIVLNWGSRTDQVRDADSHLACACGKSEVYFGDMTHKGEPEHEVNLDVDDTDWGGPETITILDPIPGNYVYWVNNFSRDATLGGSDVVVRVVLGDIRAGEYRIPEDYSRDDWRPFKSILVDADGTPRVEPLDPNEAGTDAPGQVPSNPNPGCDDCDQTSCVIGGGLLLWFVLAFVIRAIKRKL